MSDDLLERASRALKETTEPTRDELDALRTSVLASAVQAKTSRGRVGRWVLPMAAAFVAGTALAATTGQLERVARTVDAWFSPSPPRADVPAANMPRAPSRPAPVAPAPSQASEAAPPSEALAPPEPSVSAPADAIAPAPRVREQTPTPRRTARTEPNEPATESGTTNATREPTSAEAIAPVVDATPPAPPAPAPNPDLDAYRVAHRTHFGGAAPDVALRAWDSYLERFPSGTFALEARYNRALCLVKLGRHRDAIQALTPFAEGRMGRGYRRDEARELLRTLGGEP